MNQDNDENGRYRQNPSPMGNERRPGVSGELAGRVTLSQLPIGSIVAIIGALGLGGGALFLDRFAGDGGQDSAECQTCVAQRAELAERLAEIEDCAIKSKIAKTAAGAIRADLPWLLPCGFPRRYAEELDLGPRDKPAPIRSHAD